MSHLCAPCFSARSLFEVFLCALCLLALAWRAEAAMAEYSPQMPQEHLACRHASWAAAERCRETWPMAQGRSVVMHITLDRSGAVRRVLSEPDVRAFSQCVRQRLGARRFTLPHRARTEVVSRYVFR